MVRFPTPKHWATVSRSERIWAAASCDKCPCSCADAPMSKVVSSAHGSFVVKQQLRFSFALSLHIQRWSISLHFALPLITCTLAYTSSWWVTRSLRPVLYSRLLWIRSSGVTVTENKIQVIQLICQNLIQSAGEESDEHSLVDTSTDSVQFRMVNYCLTAYA
jgi:hypothetical protein